MGLFADNANTYVVSQNKWPMVKKALEDCNDGSYEEFLEVLHNPLIAAQSVAEAVTRTTGIPLTDRSILRWRRDGNGRV